MKNSPLLGTTARYLRGLLVTPRSWRDGDAERPCGAAWWESHPATSETWRRRFARACPFPLVFERALLANAAASRNLPVVRLRQLLQLEQYNSRATRNLYARYLSTFEDAVAHVVDDAPLLARLANLFPSVAAGVPEAARPARLFEADTVGHHTVLAAVHARLLVAALAVFEMRGKECAPPEHVDRATYLATLFTDTHLDLLAAAVRYGRGDDCFWYGIAPPRVGVTAAASSSSSPPLVHVYPLPHRVECFDELPNVSTLLVGADLLFDTGRQKRSPTLLRMITHVFLCKAMPQICHVRHIVDAIRSKRARMYPAVARLAERIVAVVLLGNVPDATNRLGLAARIRFALALRSDPLDANPQTKRKPDAPDEVFWAWAERNKMVLLFALREHFITACESESVSDRILGRHIKWHDYKRVVRATMARIRTALSAQAAADFAAPTQWEAPDIRAAVDDGQTLALETCSKILKGRAASLIRKKMVATTRRLVLHYALLHLTAHPPLLTALAAVQSGDAGRARAGSIAVALAEGRYSPHTPAGRALCASLEAVLGTGKDDGPPCATEDDIPDAVRTALPRSALAAMTRASPRRVVREYVLRVAYVQPAEARLAPIASAIHLAAWYAARRSMAHDASAHDRATPQLRWLQALGMSRTGCQVVRRWVYDYVVLHTADDRYQQRSFALGCASLDDFVLVKAYFHLYEQYQAMAGQRVIFRPVAEAQRQLTLLRDTLAIEPFEPTPPELGVALLCTSCWRWATAIQEAPSHVVPDFDIVLAADLVRRRRPIPKKEERRCARLRQIQTDEAARLGRPTALPPGALPLVEVGESSHFLDLRDGACYCERGKPEKTALANQRRATTLTQTDVPDAHGARQAARSVVSSPSPPPPRLSQSIESEDEDDDDEEGGEDSSSDEEIELDLAPVSEDDDVMDLADARSIMQIARIVTRDDAAGATTPGSAKETAAGKKKKKKRSDAPPPLSRFVGAHERHMIMLPDAHLTQGARGCANEPLLAVDMVGIWYRVAGAYYGLCCYCGNLTRVAAEKMTSRGLSCMNHVHMELGERHPHITGFAPAHPDRMARHGMLLRRPVRCAACPGLYTTTTVVRVFDAVYRVYELPLCRVHIGVISRLAPLLAAGRRESGRAIAPIPLIDVLVAIGNSRAHVKRREKQRSAAATPSGKSKAAAAAAATTTTPPKRPGNTRAMFARLVASPRLQAALAACTPEIRDAFSILYVMGGQARFETADSAVVAAVSAAMSNLPPSTS